MDVITLAVKIDPATLNEAERTEVWYTLRRAVFAKAKEIVNLRGMYEIMVATGELNHIVDLMRKFNDNKREVSGE